MKTTPTTDPISQALDTLAAAGMSFTVVEKCPAPGCTVCRPPVVSAAA